jgi:acetyltransferase-like isoleucine patch superfamily enzyme
MATLFHRIVHSQNPFVRWLKSCRRAVERFTLPAPKILVRPYLWIYLAFRTVYYFCLRVFICEPIFKAYCKKVGKGVRTDIYVPFISGQGDIIVEDNVLLDGRVSIRFATRYADCPRLTIGARTRIGHNCAIIVAKNVSIGSDCLIAADTLIFESSGHHTDPDARLAGLPPTDDMVKPVHIGNNVWIGKRSMIFPGITIGDGAVVAAGSIVMRDVPPNTLVAGNPARVAQNLIPQEAPAKELTPA